MLFDIGWPELLLIGVVALVVIGPKDLPRALRIAGFWVRKARTMSREFQSSVEQLMREAELDEMRRELTKVTDLDLEREFQRTIDADGSLADSLKPPTVPDYLEEKPAQQELALPEPAAEEPPSKDAAAAAGESEPGEAGEESSAPQLSAAEPPARASEPPKP